MIKNIGILLMLLFAVKIPSSAQIFLTYKGDTLSCYTDKEMDMITKKVVLSNELQERLRIANERLSECNDREAYLQAQIAQYEEIRTNMDQILVQKDVMIENRDEVIVDKDKDIQKLAREVKKQKTLKIIGTSIFAAATAYFIIH